MQMIKVISDKNLNKFPGEGSVPLQEKVTYYIYLC
jgi:hypothetical protein